MAVATFSRILQDILQYRLEDVTKLVKALENLTQKLKQSACMKEFDEKDDVTRALIIRLSIQSYCHSLKSAKLARAVEKSLRCLPTLYSVCFILEMKVVLQQLLLSNNLSDMKTLTALLDQKIAIELITENHFDAFLNLLHNILKVGSHLLHEIKHVEDEEYRRSFVKLCVQVLQLFPQDMKSVFSSYLQYPNCAVISSADDEHHYIVTVATRRQTWERIIAALLSLLLQSSSQDIVLLTGTALAMTFNYAPTIDMTQNGCQSVLSVLSCGVTYFTFAGMEFDIQKLMCNVPSDVSVPMTAFVKGILSSCDKEAISLGHKPLLLLLLPGILQLCHGPSIHHYLAFQLLQFWYKKLEYIEIKYASSFVLTVAQIISQEMTTHQQQLLMFQMSPTIPDDRNAESVNKNVSSSHPIFMSRDCQILTSTLICIWPNWDSPVEGVSELIIEIFDSLLRIWCQTVKAGISPYVDLCAQLMSRVLSLTWHSKARYRPLRVLLTYVDCVQVIERNNELRHDLMRCMKANQLASVVSDVYTTSIQQIIISCHSQQAKVLQIWTRLWMPTLLDGLTSTDSLQPLKTRTYWLPPTLKLIAGSYKVLLNFIEEHLNSSDGLSRQCWLFAWTSVSALGRQLLPTPDCCVTSDLLQESLLSADDEIRIEALRLLCTSIKRGEPMSNIEASLLQEFIPSNLKTDSAAFRQNMISSLKIMFVRIRDSCLFAVRNSQTEDYLLQGLQFIEWLFEILMNCLVPGSCYQRRQTSLDLLATILETLVYQPKGTSRKGKAQECSDILLVYAQTKDLWQFFSADNLMTLVYCLEDGALEIQTQCYHLLVKYFTWSRTSWEIMSASDNSQRNASIAQSSVLSSLLSMDRTCAELFHRALYLISSSRAHENHSGVMMMSLVMNRYIIRNQWDSSSSCEHHEVIHDTEHSAMANPDCHIISDRAISILDYLIDRIQISLDAVVKDLGTSFHINSIHGLTQSMTRCLLDIASGMSQNLININKDDWRRRLEIIVTLNQKLIHFVLEVLAGKQSFESCPSFAEMGVALNSLISTGQEQEDGTLSTSPEFQLLLSWCWLNVKESCSCLGEVSSLVAANGGTSISMLSDIGEIFVKVLTTCRHKGAIEGSRHGLHHFCSYLISSGVADFTEIPCTILQQILVSLSHNSLSSSATRRSAGLPIFIHTVIQAVYKNGNKDLLMSTVDHLYNVASQQLPTDYSQNQDMSQGHALNILKTIFCDASLATKLLPLLSKMTVLVVKGFDSPSWSIRNAATQLISTLVVRIFGQKSSEDASSGMSLEDFSTQYPQLVQFVCEMMTEYSKANTTVKPSLYIVLTLLSQLAMSPLDQHSCSCRQLLGDSILYFISSPVISLRQLSARTYVTLSPLDMADTTFEHILNKIKQRELKLNELHGWLLTAVHLVSSGNVSHKMCTYLLMFVVKNKWLLFKCSSCLLQVSTLMHIIHLVLASSKYDITLLQSLWQLVEDCIQSISSSEVVLQIDREQCLRRCVQILMTFERACDGSTEVIFREQLQEFLNSKLSSTVDDLRDVIMDCLQTVAHDTIKEPSIQRCILANMTRETTHVTRLMQSADLLMTLTLRGDLHLQSCDFLNFDLPQRKYWGKLPIFEKSTFLMDSVLIASCRNSLLENNRYQTVMSWCQLLLLYTQHTCNESLRLYAAQSLAVAGGNILNLCRTNQTLPDIDKLLIILIKASLQLLEDTEDEVRQLVSCFVCQAQGKAAVYFSWCYPALTRLICEEFSWCSDIVSTLLDKLYRPGQLKKAITCAMSIRSAVLFEPETSSSMSETLTSQMWAYNTLQQMLTVDSSQVLQQLKSKIVYASEDLSSNISTIRDNISAFPVFNISCDPEVLSSLVGMICLNCLHMSIPGALFTSTNQETDSICLQDRIQSLLQIPSLHPFLRKSQTKDLPVALCGLVTKDLPVALCGLVTKDLPVALCRLVMDLSVALCELVKDLPVALCGLVMKDLPVALCGLVMKDLPLALCGLVTKDLSVALCWLVMDLPVALCGLVMKDLPVALCGLVMKDLPVALCGLVMKDLSVALCGLVLDLSVALCELVKDLPVALCESFPNVAIT